MTLLGNARVVTPGGVLSPGWVRIEGSRIEAVGSGPPTGQETEVRDLGGAWLLPGFVDIHVHGGGGASMTDADAAQILQAVEFHRRHGTTRTLVSLVTAPLETMLAGAAVVADLVHAGVPGIAGSHLEGPFLSRPRRGAQDPDSLLAPDAAVLERLLAAGRGTVRMVTVAPELPGALELIRAVTAAGAVAAVGHTDASYEEAARGFEAGARVATHLFNGMRPLHHRDPGAVAAALERADVVCELVNDGIHLAPSAIRLVALAAGPDRMALITDAISATGMPDGDYLLGPKPVRVREGRATLAEGGTIAGSTLTMDRAFRRTVREVGLPVEDAVTAASATPARVLGLEAAIGAIAPGREADLVVLDESLELVEVMGGGSRLSLEVGIEEKGGTRC